jgi:hypothetical protein
MKILRFLKFQKVKLDSCPILNSAKKFLIRQVLQPEMLSHLPILDFYKRLCPNFFTSVSDTKLESKILSDELISLIPETFLLIPDDNIGGLTTVGRDIAVLQIFNIEYATGYLIAQSIVILLYQLTRLFRLKNEVRFKYFVKTQVKIDDEVDGEAEWSLQSKLFGGLVQYTNIDTDNYKYFLDVNQWGQNFSEKDPKLIIKNHSFKTNCYIIEEEHMCIRSIKWQERKLVKKRIRFSGNEKDLLEGTSLGCPTISEEFPYSKMEPEEFSLTAVVPVEKSETKRDDQNPSSKHDGSERHSK